MVFRIIYRPSYQRLTVTPSAVDAAAVSFAPDATVCEADPVAKPGPRSHRVALHSLALLLLRLGFGAMAIAAWRIAVDLGLPLPFVIKDGVLSHWQVWFGGGVLLVAGAGAVARRLQFGKARDEDPPGRAQAA